MRISKKLTITIGLFGTMVLGIAASLPQQKVLSKPQNLKVLPKNISDRDLDRTMDIWSASLGVHCNFCHARNEQTNKMDFASDAKPEKTAARDMFEMTAKINKKFFKGEKDSLGMVMETSINCYTCHRGDAHPEIKVPERKHDQKPVPNGGGVPSTSEK